MPQPDITHSANLRDPWVWTLILAVTFWALSLVRLTLPGHLYFDEVHYIPAARELLKLGEFANREHPMLGKIILAEGIRLLGDNPLGWRLLPSFAGALTLFAAMRAMWLASCDRYATIAFGLLLATGFLLFVHARIAMLDIFMLMFLTIAYWQLALAVREPEHGRRGLIVAGIALGAAMGSKWNAAPLAVIPGLAFLILRYRAGRRRLLLSRRGAPVPGVSLVEAALWLGVVPLAVYAATFWPGHFYAVNPIENGLVAHHKFMFELQSGLKTPHTYQSTWSEWIVNWRAIWYLYEFTDGAQRGVLLIGNPVTMLLGLPALVWCAWAGIRNGNRAALAVAILYTVSIGFWIVAAKPVQFYYHYLVPSCFLLAALALVLGEFHNNGRKWLAVLPLVASIVVFVEFYPILSAALLADDQAFRDWMWLDSWR